MDNHSFDADIRLRLEQLEISRAEKITRDAALSEIMEAQKLEHLRDLERKNKIGHEIGIVVVAMAKDLGPHLPLSNVHFRYDTVSKIETVEKPLLKLFGREYKKSQTTHYDIVSTNLWLVDQRVKTEYKTLYYGGDYTEKYREHDITSLVLDAQGELSSYRASCTNDADLVRFKKGVVHIDRPRQLQHGRHVDLDSFVPFNYNEPEETIDKWRGKFLDMLDPNSVKNEF